MENHPQKRFQIKIYFGENNIRRCSFQNPPLYSEFLETFQQLFRSETENNKFFKFEYVDSEGDHVVVGSEIEWQEMLFLFKETSLVKVTAKEIKKEQDEPVLKIHEIEHVTQEDEKVVQEDQSRDKPKTSQEEKNPEEEEEHKRKEEERRAREEALRRLCDENKKKIEEVMRGLCQMKRQKEDTEEEGPREERERRVKEEEGLREETEKKEEGVEKKEEEVLERKAMEEERRMREEVRPKEESEKKEEEIIPQWGNWGKKSRKRMRMEKRQREEEKRRAKEETDRKQKEEAEKRAMAEKNNNIVAGFSDQLQQLNEMGYTDTSRNLKLLYTFNGRLEDVVNVLCSS